MKIITNTAISLDGKIAPVSGHSELLGSAFDLEELSRIRGMADAILVGGRTLQNWPMPFLPREEHCRRDYSLKPMWNAVVTRGAVQISSEALQESRIRPIIFTEASNKNVQPPVEIEKAVGRVTPDWIVECLRKRGVETLLIEAGGDLIAQFLAAGLVDEMHVTLCPKIIGGTKAPSLVGGDGFDSSSLPQLELVSERVVGSEIFLHYRVLKKIIKPL